MKHTFAFRIHICRSYCPSNAMFAPCNIGYCLFYLLSEYTLAGSLRNCCLARADPFGTDTRLCWVVCIPIGVSQRHTLAFGAKWYSNIFAFAIRDRKCSHHRDACAAVASHLWFRTAQFRAEIDEWRRDRQKWWLLQMLTKITVLAVISGYSGGDSSSSSSYSASTRVCCNT